LNDVDEGECIMKATPIALAALSLFMGATPVSARDYGPRDRDYSWRDYDCRRYDRLTDRKAVVVNHVGRLCPPGNLIKSYAWPGWRRVPFI
jgi:hypothetical protein